MKLSKRILSMQSSPIRKLMIYAVEAKAQGKKVYHLNIGQPDIVTPKPFMEAVRKFDEDIIKYTASKGEDFLIEAIVNYFKVYNVDLKEKDIIITNGGSEAIMFSIMAICNPAEEVLVFEPFYTNYNGFTQATGVECIPVTTYANQGFHLPKKEEIVKKITKKTRGILISNPGNPTGVVYSKEEMDLLAEIALEYDLFIIADEVYREFIYDGLEFTSFGTIKKIENRLILIDSVSKKYSACGARIGCVASKNNELIANILKLCQSRLCVPLLEQIGSAALYRMDISFLADTKIEYNRRRDLTFACVSEIPNVICRKPTGAFYMIAKLPIKNAEDFVKWLLSDFSVNNETVMFAPAEGFYGTPGLGKDEIRIAYVLNEDDLKKALNILKLGLEQYLKLVK